MRGGNLGVELKLFAGLREVSDKEKFDFSAKDVGELISKLVEYNDVFAEKIYSDSDGKDIREGYSVLVNGRNIKFLEGLETPLEEGDRVTIFPPVGGG